jgi:hypothetical protein
MKQQQHQQTLVMTLYKCEQIHRSFGDATTPHVKKQESETNPELPTVRSVRVLI